MSKILPYKKIILKKPILNFPIGTVFNLIFDKSKTYIVRLDQKSIDIEVPKKYF